MLSAEVEIPIRFSEVDSLRIVWHGHYIQYFEDAREAFGAKYNFRYLEVYGKGYVMPIVKISCEYKRPLKYGDTAIVKADYIPTEAAKVIFKYEIRSKASQELLATGESMQVFLDSDMNLMLTVPEYIQQWKKQHGL